MQLNMAILPIDVLRKDPRYLRGEIDNEGRSTIATDTDKERVAKGELVMIRPSELDYKHKQKREPARIVNMFNYLIEHKSFPACIAIDSSNRLHDGCARLIAASGLDIPLPAVRIKAKYWRWQEKKPKTRVIRYEFDDQKDYERLLNPPKYNFSEEQIKELKEMRDRMESTQEEWINHKLK